MPRTRNFGIPDPDSQAQSGLTYITKMLKQQERLDAERRTAPVATHRAVAALNDRMDGLLALTQTLADVAHAQVMEARATTRLTRVIAALTVLVVLLSIVALIVSLTN